MPEPRSLMDTRRTFLQKLSLLGLLPLFPVWWRPTALRPLRSRADRVVCFGVGNYAVIFDPPLRSSHVAVIAYVSTGRLDVQVLELPRETNGV